MIVQLLISLACLIFVQAHNIQKRGIFDNLPIGGNLGCVVTGNTLYINGFRDRELTSSEQSELQQYQQQMSQFQDQMKQFKQQMHQMRQQMRGHGPRGRWGRPMMQDQGQDQDYSNDNNMPPQQQAPPTPPTPPSRPSFCNDNVTTQYIFDGCKVQDGKVYVGNSYARDLTQDEISQLNQYNTQLDAWTDQLNQEIQQQLNGLMAQSADMGDYNSNDNGNDGGDYGTGPTDATSTDSSVPSTTATALMQPPTPPNFCTVIF